MLGIFQEKLHFFPTVLFFWNQVLFSPHLCVEFLFLILYPTASSSSASASSAASASSHTIFHTQLCHPPSFTQHLCHTPPFTHNFVTHHLSHNIFTHNFVTHHLSHTIFTHNFVTHHLSHTIFHPNFVTLHLCHTQSLSPTIFHTQSLSHTIFHTQSLSPTIFPTQSLSPTIFPTQSLSPTIFHTHLCHTPSLTHNLCHPPSFTHNFVTHHLCHTPSFTHHLCHTPSFTHNLGRHVPSFHVAGVALRDIHFGFAWQAWHPTLRGKCGTWRHLPWFCVAGTALGDIYLRFAWQAWQFVTSTFVLRGRRGTYRKGWLWWRAWARLGAGDAAQLCVAGVALGDIYLAWFCVAGVALGDQPPSFSVAGVTLMALGWLWWRAWARLVAGDAAQLCVAGVALGDIHLAWFCVAGMALGDSQHWTGSGGALGRAWSPVTPPNFAWQAWHLETSTFVSHGWRGMQTWHFLTSTFVLRGRRGTCGTGLALVARLGALGRRRRRPTLRGMRGTWRDPPSFRVACVAGIHLRFAWQAWHLWHWAGSGGALGRAWSPVSPPNFAWQAWHLETSTFVSLGRHGTWWHPLSFCVAGVALRDIHLRFAWQSWHLATSAFVSRGRRGTYGIGLAVYIFLSSNELFVLCSHSCKWHALMTLHGTLGPCTLFFCHAPSFTHRFVTHHLSHTTFTHTILHTKLCHIHHFLCRTPSFTYHFVTHNSSHTTCFTSWSSTTFLCLSFLPRPRYNICYSLLEEVDLWGYPVL